MSASRRERLTLLLRALAFQGSWNYETLNGTGFAFMILPSLRRLYPDPGELDEAIRRHEEPFNSHPYFAPLALGAVVRLEEEETEPATIGRLKAALRGSLGTLGDQLVWTGWRPICLLVALLLLLVGAPWWVAVLTFLFLYNLGHIALMVWGLSVGLNDGRRVAERLRTSTVGRLQPRFMTIGMFLSGLAVGLTAVNGVPGLETGTEARGTLAVSWPWLIAIAALAAAGARWGERARKVAAIGVLAFAVVGLVAGGLA